MTEIAHIKRKKRADFHLFLTSLPFLFLLKSISLNYFQSDFLRKPNYAGRGPFVFQLNIREWSLWVISIFHFCPVIHLVSYDGFSPKQREKTEPHVSALDPLKASHVRLRLQKSSVALEMHRINTLFFYFQKPQTMDQVNTSELTFYYTDFCIALIEA